MTAESMPSQVEVDHPHYTQTDDDMEKGVGERAAVIQLLSTLTLVPGDVAIMDRGLPSRALFSELLAREVDLVARMSASDTSGWTEVTEFLKSGKLNETIDFDSALSCGVGYQ